MTRALSRNLGAQVYAQAVTFAVQLGMLPLLIWAWGVETFGVWALLTAIPAYLSFSDFGFTFIAKNDMAMRVAAGDREGAIETFQSILALLVLVATALGFALLGLVCVLPLDRIFNLGGLPLDEVRWVLGLQIVMALIYQFFLLASAGVRCEGHAALETVFGATGRFVEATAIAAAVLSGGSLLAATLGALVARLAALVFVTGWLRFRTPWLRIGFSVATRARLACLFGPSVGYMAVPISNALLIQAPVLILGAVATPAAVALFSVSRTVARLGMAATNMVTYAFVPEYSFAWGRRDGDGFRHLLRLQTGVIWAAVAMYAAAAFWLLPWGVRLVSHGQIAPRAALCAALATGVVFEMLWTSVFAPLSAVNRHRVVARAFLVFSVAAIVVSMPLATPVAIGWAVATAQLCTMLVALPQVFVLRRALPGGTGDPHQQATLARGGLERRIEGGLQR